MNTLKPAVSARRAWGAAADTGPSAAWAAAGPSGPHVSSGPTDPGRRWALAGVLATAAVLSGCAAMNTVGSDVSTFGSWPAERKPGTWAFERLPSQQAQAEQMDVLEAAAAGALLKAGFTPVPAGQEPDVLVQVGARSSRSDANPWADPLWWRGSFGYYRHGPWIGPRWGLSASFDAQRYEREVAVLIRDRASGKPLFEARASNEASSAQAGPATLTAMFEAALMDFPKLGVNPRRVLVTLPG